MSAEAREVLIGSDESFLCHVLGRVSVAHVFEREIEYSFFPLPDEGVERRGVSLEIPAN